MLPPGWLHVVYNRGPDWPRTVAICEPAAATSATPSATAIARRETILRHSREEVQALLRCLLLSRHRGTETQRSRNAMTRCGRACIPLRAASVLRAARRLCADRRAEGDEPTNARPARIPALVFVGSPPSASAASGRQSRRAARASVLNRLRALRVFVFPRR